MSDADRLLSRQHADPHAYLGAHSDNGVDRRARVPARGRARDGRGRQEADRARAGPSRRRVRGAARRREAAARLPARGRLRRVRHGHDRRPVPLPADGRRARRAPLSARAATRSCGSGSARTCARSTASWARRSRSGRRPRAAVSVVGDFNFWDGRIHPMRSLGSSGIWELFLPGVGHGARLQVRDRRAGRRGAAEGRPGRVRTPRCRRRRRRSSTTRATSGPTTSGWRSGARARRSRARCRSTRSTSARGG